MNEHRDNPQRAAQRQRSRIAHEDLRRMTIEPKKAEPRADHRQANDRQLARARDVGHLKIAGRAEVAREIGHRREHRGDDQRAANRQSVEAVGEIHGVRAADDGGGRQDESYHNSHRSRGHRILHKRHHHFRDQLLRVRIAPEIERDENSQSALNPQLDVRRRALVALLRDLGVIVVEAQAREDEHRDQRERHMRAPLSPEQRRHIHHPDHENAAHRRRAALRMAPTEPARLLRLVYVVLAELQALEPRDDLRPQPQAQRQRRDERARAAKADVAKQPQEREFLVPCRVLGNLQQVLTEIIKHFLGATF